MQIQDNNYIQISKQEDSNSSSWIELDKKKFFHNIALLKTLTKNKAFALVVKANAYGHGILPISKMAEENLNIDYLCTFKLSEALFLRQNKINKPILVLGLIDENFSSAMKNNIELTVFDLETAIKLDNEANKLNKKAEIHIKIDTGLSRLGFLYNDLKSIKQITQLKNVNVKGIYSHFSESDSANTKFTNVQIKRFVNLLNKLSACKIEIPLKHIENSSAVIRFDKTSEFNLVRIGGSAYALSLNFVRIGGAAYGIKKDFIEKAFPLNLEPIFTWKSKIISKKNIPAGSYISYGRTHRVKVPTTIGIIPVGYCDGYDRRLSNNSFVLINNKRAPILGRVCMNMTVLDITDIDADIGTEVTLMCNVTEISPNNLAKSLDTISYELLTRINSNIRRVII